MLQLIERERGLDVTKRPYIFSNIDDSACRISIEKKNDLTLHLINSLIWWRVNMISNKAGCSLLTTADNFEKLSIFYLIFNES